MDIYVRALHNYTIQPSDKYGKESVVDSVTKKFLSCDTALSSFIPSEFHKISPILRKICVWDISSFPRIFRLV